MLTFDSVRLRLEREQPLSFIEFNYMIFQAYDFLHLARTSGCGLQVGGSDQWGNIVCGVDLVRRCLDVPSFGLTTPLLTTASGAKMGKTADGAVWLEARLKSPYDYWQYWRNIDDKDVERFMLIFTDMSVQEIKTLCQETGDINHAKKVLADQATTLVHGQEEARLACETASRLFETNVSIADLQVQVDASGVHVDTQLPVVSVSADFFETPKLVIDGLMLLTFVQSRSEARRLIQGGGVRLNDLPVSDETHPLVREEAYPNGLIKLSVGKKKHGLLYCPK